MEEEDRMQVARVLSARGYRERLGVGDDATEEEVKSAYRAVSKKVHPDKNKAEGATEAFKKLSIAYRSILERGGPEASEEEGEGVQGRGGFHKWPWERWEEEEGEAWAEWVRREAAQQGERRKRDEARFLAASALLLLLLAVLGVAMFPGRPARQAREGERRGVEEVERLASQGQMFQQCSPAKKTMCAILVLPSAAACDRACRQRHLRQLSSARHRLRHLPTGWLWTVAGEQVALEQMVGGAVEGTTPLLVVVAWGRGKVWRKELGRPGGWAGEVDTVEVAGFVRRCGRGEEGGSGRLQGEGMPRVRVRGLLEEMTEWWR